MTIQEAAIRIAALPFVEKVSVWTKVAGKERIYIDMKRYDRSGNVFGGVGGICYIDINSGKLVYGTNGYNGSPFCNSYTKSFHEDNGSFAKIKDAAGL